VINFQEGLPWNRSEEMEKASPLFDVHKVKTPTLIHVGENDPRCPPEHSRMLYRSLHEYLQVPVELIVYPGEGHSLSRYEHRKAHMEWDMAWFKRYLLRPDNGEGKTARSERAPSQGAASSSSGGASSNP
jgi:dipeptidyl aminopeptidase/acylaminoacyl peptidase